MEPVNTARLLLRGWRMEDARDLFAYAQSPVVGPAAGWRPHETIQDSQSIIRLFIEKDDCWAITLKHTGRVIGSVGLHPDSLRPDINARMLGYVLAPQYWGHGLAAEAARAAVRFAFETAQVDLLSVYHYPHNQRSRRVVEKCGFTYEGELRRACKIYNGKIYNIVCYSLTRPEFDELNYD